MDDTEGLLIYRGHRHFGALVLIEVCIWGSVAAVQLGIIGMYYVHCIPYLKHALG